MVYICEGCDYSTLRLANYNKHVNSNKHLNKINDLQFKYVCEECKYKTDKKINYSRHLQSKKHLKNLNNQHKFYCKSCDFRTDFINSYNKHLNTKKHLSMIDSEKSVKEFNCEECNFCTSKKFDFSRHLRTKKHIMYQQGTISSDITPSVSVISLESIDSLITDDENNNDERVPVKNTLTGEIRYASNAPKRKNISIWLENHQDWVIHEYTKRATKNEQIAQLLKKVLKLVEEML